ncbi:Homocysteine-induced endoplasmic reticulum protein [Carabus blaptoides fortunei]
MTIPVTLIVKAPNQQIDDQTVKCELSWTIHKLKSHLSEVYPSKPAKDEQKLIYSGQLLSDTVVLKDVLRNYDGENTHTVHLVCTPSRNYKPEQAAPKPSPIMDQLPQTPPDASPTTSTTGLRQRSVNNINQETMTDYRTMWASFAQPYGNVPDPSQYALQTALLQQAYAQYINQYMQMVTNQLPRRPADTQTEPEIAAAAAVVAPDPVNGGEPAAGAVADEPDVDEPPADRDWLDWFYVFSRVLVLFCIVYFYSSPLRFTLVLLLGIGLYLYQMGFFRAQAANNNEARRPENNNVPAAQVPTDETTNQSTHAVIIDQRPTMLNIMWTFFTTFFASLIPEIPNAV